MKELEDEIKDMIVRTLNLEEITVGDIASDEQLFGGGLGLDSIDALEIGVAIGRKYGIKMEASDKAMREHFRSVGSLAKFVAERRGAKVG